jgi:DNA-binding transcriptional LysR family regulator
MLDAGVGDFAFISKTSKDTDLKYLPILKDPLRWIGLKSDPLAGKKKIEFKDLQDRQLIVLRQGAIREMVEPLILKIKSSLPMIEVDQQSTLIGMVAAGLGISFLPSLSCQSWANPETTHRALDFGDFHRIIQITRYVDQDLMPCVTEFIRLYLREIQDSKFNSKDGVELIPVGDKAIANFLN